MTNKDAMLDILRARADEANADLSMAESLVSGAQVVVRDVHGWTIQYGPGDATHGMAYSETSENIHWSYDWGNIHTDADKSLPVRVASHIRRTNRRLRAISFTR